jgi:serine/threonine protein kinase
MANIDVIEAGQTIDQYKIVRLIANTQKSHCYLVEAPGLHKHLVLKLFAARTTPLASRKFVDQANLLLEFSQNSHIVNVMHLGTFGERPYMVMPYYPQTLNDLLALHYQKLSFLTSLGIIKQVLWALQSLHRLEIIHLDIKPQNLYLDEANNAELADFDNALVLETSPLYGRFNSSIDGSFDAENDLLGYTIAYASPEQVTRTTQATVLEKSSDLYSLGALWFRMLVGDTLYNIGKQQSVDTSKTFIETQLHNLAPKWGIELITNLLNVDAVKRPSTDDCLAQIMQHSQTPHINQTICIEAIPESLNLTDIQKDIKEILLNEGWVSQASQTRLLATYKQLNATSTLKNTSESEKQLYESMQLVIADCEKQLITEKNLSAWFGWINYIQVLLEKSGAHIRSDQYLQMLQVGKASRPDNPAIAEFVLKKHFHTDKLSSAWAKRYLLPFIVILLVIFYWAKLGQENTIISKQNEETSSFIDKTVSRDEISKVMAAENILASDAVSKDEQQSGEFSSNTLDNADDSAFSSAGIYTFTIREGYAQASVTANWVKIKALPGVKIMATEVSNSLYQMCIEEGACRKTKQFSTAAKSNLEGTAELPKTGLSWYEITEQFIPWLNRKTNRTFTLPNLTQWQIYSRSAIFDIKTKAVAHCNGCRSPLARQFNGGIMPVDIIEPDSNGLYHVLGNAQEWLSSCWQQQSKDGVVAQRCDQAIVAGGSWLNNKSDWQGSYIAQLLKTAKTPTTGFRLVEILND